MSQYSVPLKKIVEELDITVVRKSSDFDTKQIVSASVDRPALKLAGVYNYFDADRMQVIGRVETSFNEGEATPLNFTGTEEGIRIESSNFVPLFRYLYPEQEKQLHNTVSGTVTFSRGNAISVPQYKNLSEWSLDDFLALLENIGSLIGIFP